MRNTRLAKAWFRVMRPLGAFVLVFLEAQIKSACISRNTFCEFSINQWVIKLITLSLTLIIPDITKTSSNYSQKLIEKLARDNKRTKL